MIEFRIVPHNIGPFHRHNDYPTSMEYGFYYEGKLKLPFAQEERTVRVWLPGSYDFVNPKKHPVMYMSDGQNLVDKYLTQFGDWHLDKVMMKLQKRGYLEPILVGIDSPRDAKMRANELNPPYTVKRKYRKGNIDHPMGNQFIDYIVKELKPLIDSLFSTDPSKEATAIGGSSMGGIMAFYGFLAYPQTFGFSLCFSIPFFFYSKRDLRRILKLHNPLPRTHGRLAIFVGGKDFEKDFVKGDIYMLKKLRKRGFDERVFRFYHDPELPHHEESWYRFADPAFRFWLKKLS